MSNELERAAPDFGTGSTPTTSFAGQAPSPSVQASVSGAPAVSSGLKQGTAARKRKLPPLTIQEVIAMGIGAKFDESQEGWLVEGFYKAKGLLLKYEEGTEKALAFPISQRRAAGQAIKSFDDLVELNYAWWVASRKESTDYEQPEEGWKDEFVERDMVERRMTFLPRNEAFNPLKQN